MLYDFFSYTNVDQLNELFRRADDKVRPAFVIAGG
jgi:hypothetical protein